MPLGSIEQAVLVSTLLSGDIDAGSLVSRMRSVAVILRPNAIYNQTMYTAEAMSALQHLMTSLNIASDMVERRDSKFDSSEEENCCGCMRGLAGTCEGSKARGVVAIKVVADPNQDSGG
jgi:hypothetical protein